MAATDRKVQNRTGLDLSVAVPAGAGAQTMRYNVIVVTTLPQFKNPRKHGLADTIQFGKERDHKDFKKLSDALLKASPDAMLPPLPPRSTRVPVGDRVKMLSQFVDAIAGDKALCANLGVCDFLGVSAERAEAATKAFAEMRKRQKKPDLLFGDDDETGDGRVQAPVGLQLEEEEEEDSDEADLVAESLAALSVEGGNFLRADAEDDDPLGLGTAASASEEVELDADTNELLSIDNDDLDKLLQAKPRPKPAAAKTPKRAAPKADGLDDLFGPADALEPDVSDIAAYIKANQAAGDAELFD